MTTITSACGTVETVTVRRTESCDAQQIHDLINPSTVAVFGRVNVIHLLERANLAVTLANAENEVLAHAAFFDCPVGDVVDQALWEPFLHRNFSTEKCTTLNTLFLHLFVAQSSFATASVKEIVRAVFNVITELQYICLVSPNISRLEPALDEVFEPMKRLRDPVTPQCLAFVCHRHAHCPALHVRRARVEDHDDLTHIFTEQSKELSASWGPFHLAELIETQDHLNQAAVCESGGVAVGFISVSGDVDLELLNQSFELSAFDGLYERRRTRPDPSEHAPQGERSDAHVSAPQDPAEKVSDEEEEQTEESLMRGDASEQAPQSDQSEAGNHRQHTTEQEAEQVEKSSEQDDVHVSPPSETAERENTHAAVPGASGWSGSPKTQPNAFCVRLFVIDKKHEMRSVDFLPHIFTLFPDRDYCVLTLGTLALEFPLIQSFVRAEPRPSSALCQELYVLHRAALLKCVEVRPAVSADRPAVSAMVEGLSVHEALLEDLDVFCHAKRDPDGTPVQAFVAEVQRQIVGVLIIRSEEDMEYIRSHYDVEDFIYFSQHRMEDHARLWHFVLRPAFQRHAKHFLKEALRLAHRTCLYYRVYPPGHAQGSCVLPVPCVLSCTVPARPRRQVAYPPLETLGVNAPSRQVTQEQAPYALNLLSRKLSMEPKVTINARLVVVGASDTALSFLETLVFCPHLWFNNVTLISTHGYPGNHHHHNNDDDISFLSTSHGYRSRDRVHLCSVVSVVTGTMVAIDREDRRVHVSGDRTLPYDHLILCTGLQYQVPCPTGVDLNGTITSSQLVARPRPRYAGHVPSNLFTLNDRHDCSALTLWLRDNNFMGLEDNAIVYGNSMDVYTCVEALLGLGVQGSRVHLVLPPPPSSPAAGGGGNDGAPCCFADPEVEKAVARALERAGVRVHRDRLLATMNGGEELPEPLASASFTTDTPTQPLLHLTCGVFINLSSRGVDLHAFRSLSAACLVFDGRLVIDAAGFRTNDARVRAAGPLTKFSRRYRAPDGVTHARFSSGEVGRELAAALLALFDPTVVEQQQQPGLDPATPPGDSGPGLVPVYTQPRIQGGRLPGGYNYLHVTKPSVPDSTASPSFSQHGTDIVTGRVETGNYFRLRLSRYDTVEGLTCLSLKPLPVSNYLCLYGKHQRLLNRLSSRYDEGLVHDLYSFFREPWCMALYHDRFTDFEQEIKQIIESAKAQGQGDGGGSMTTQDVEGNPKLFLQLFDRSGGLAALRSSTLNYLQYNRNHLPMYALPGML